MVKAESRWLRCRDVTKESFYDLAKEHCETPAMHRILTLMRVWGVKALVLEELKPSQELNEDMEAMRRYSLRRISRFRWERLTFFRAPVSEDYFSDSSDRGHESILASVIICSIRFKRDGKERRFVYEAGLRLPQQYLPKHDERLADVGLVSAARHSQGLLGPYFVHSRAELDAHVGNTWKTTFEGTFFCDAPYLNQDIRPNYDRLVCVHAALRMLLRHHYSRCTFAEIEKILTSVRARPGITLCPDVHHALERWQLNSVVYNFTERDLRNRIIIPEILHGLVEPGYAALVVFSTSARGVSHVVPVLGHTFNSHSWSSLGEIGYKGGDYVTTSRWVDTWITSDNNFGPLVEIRQDLLGDEMISGRKESPLTMIGVVPSPVRLSAYKSERLALATAPVVILKAARKRDYSSRWLSELSRILSEPIRRLGLSYGSTLERGRFAIATIRTVLVRKHKYLAHLSKMRDRAGNHISAQIRLQTEVDRHLIDDWYWMTEFTDPDILVGNGAKLAEFLFPAHPERVTSKTISNYNHLLRVPGFFLLSDRTVPGQYAPMPCPIESYTQVFLRSTISR